MPSASVQSPRKLAVHLLTIAGARSTSLPTPGIDRNHGGGNAEVLAAEAVVFFGIVSSVSVKSSNRQVLGGLGHGGDEAWGIVAGPQTRLG